MVRYVLLVLCLCVWTTTAIPVRTGVKHHVVKRSEADNPSPKEKVQILQRKLTDLQRNLQRLGGTIDAAALPERAPLYEPDGTIEEQIERAVGIRLSKYDDDDVEQILPEKVDSDEAPPAADLEEIKLEKVDDDDVDDEAGLTTSEQRLLEMLQAKEEGRRADDVLRRFLEDSIAEQERARPAVSDDVIDEVHTGKEGNQLKEEIGQLVPRGETEEQHPDRSAEVNTMLDKFADIKSKEDKLVDNGRFVDRSFSETEVGPVELPGRNIESLSRSDVEQQSPIINDPEAAGKDTLDAVERQIIKDLKYAVHHGISLDDLLSDVTDKEEAALEKETYELGQQLASAQRDLEKMKISSK